MHICACTRETPLRTGHCWWSMHTYARTHARTHARIRPRAFTLDPFQNAGWHERVHSKTHAHTHAERERESERERDARAHTYIYTPGIPDIHIASATVSCTEETSAFSPSRPTSQSQPPTFSTPTPTVLNVALRLLCPCLCLCLCLWARGEGCVDHPRPTLSSIPITYHFSLA